MSVSIVSLIKSVDNTLRVSSRDLAQARDWQHKNVLQVIDKLIKNMPELARLDFQPSSYTDASGKSNREFLCSEKGALLVGMNLGGVDGTEFQCDIIDAFQACRAKLQQIGVPVPMDVAQLQRAFGLALEPLVAEIVLMKQSLSTAGFRPDVDMERTLAKLNTVKLSTRQAHWVDVIGEFYAKSEGALTPRQVNTICSIARKVGALVSHGPALVAV